MKHKVTKAAKLLGNKRCPRCGSFMAKHRDRWYCGKCHYTEFLKVSE